MKLFPLPITDNWILAYLLFHMNVKANLLSWKAQALWTKLDKRGSQKCYNRLVVAKPLCSGQPMGRQVTDKVYIY